MRRTTLALMISLMASLAWYAPPARAAEAPKGMDIVLVVDVSGSLRDNDPENLRTVILRALADFWRSEPGDRLAVVQFAGWNETIKQGPVLLPLTAVPQEAQAQEDFYEKLAEIIDTQLTDAFGIATDFNVAFAQGVGEVLPAGHHDRPVWVILLTDGTLDVYEQHNTRPEYMDKYNELRELEENRNVDPRVLLASVARNLLMDQTLPALSERIETLYITPVYFARTADGDRSVLEELGKRGDVEHPLVDSRGDLFRDVFLEIITLRPGAVWQNRTVYGYERVQDLPPNGPYTRKVHVYGGTAGVRLLVFGNSPAFTVEVSKPDGEEVPVRELGDGERYRFLDLPGLPAGDYSLAIKPLADAQVPLTQVETAVFSEFQVQPRVRLVGDKTVFQIGEQAVVELTLLTRDGDVVSDPDFLSELNAEVSITTPSGEERVEEVSFADLDKATLEVPIELRQEDGLGNYGIEVAFGGVGAGGDVALQAFGLSALAEALQISARPAVHVQLQPREPLVAQVVKLTQEGQTALPADTQLHARFKSPDGELMDAPLALNAQTRKWEGTVAFPAAGEWSMVHDADLAAVVVPATIAPIPVAARELSLPAQIEFDLKYAEPQKVSQTVPLSFDLGADERASLEATLLDADPSVTVEIEPTEITDEDEEATVTLQTTSPEAVSEESFGKVAVTAKVNGVEVEREAPVQVTYTDKLSKLLMQILPYAIGALVVLIALVWYVTRPRFGEHQVRALIPGVEPNTANYLRSFGGRNRAEGPPEIKVVRFALLKKNQPVVVTPLEGGPEVYLNQDLLREPTEIKHGDSLAVYTRDDLHRFIYFEREPSPEELVDPGLILEDDEIVITED